MEVVMLPSYFLHVQDLLCKVLCCPWCLRRVVVERLNFSNQRSTQKCLAFITWLKSSLSSHCLEVIDQRIFQNWYHWFNLETRGQFTGLQNMATVSSAQFLNMTQLLRFMYSWFSNSTLLLYSRIHLDSEDLLFVLMWYFSLDPIGVNVVAL